MIKSKSRVEVEERKKIPLLGLDFVLGLFSTPAPAPTPTLTFTPTPTSTTTTTTTFHYHFPLTSLALTVFSLLVSHLSLPASPLYFSGRLADPVTGAAWAGDFSATLTLARAADGTGAVTNVAASVTADANGLFAFAVPLPVEELFSATGDAYLVASFTDGTRQTTLPAQRVGYAPYAVHADAVYAANVTTGAVSTLAVTNFSAVSAVTARESLNVTGTMVVTGGVTFAKNGLAALSIDRLTLYGGVTRFLSGAGTAASALCAEGEVQTLAWTAATDALVTLEAEVPEAGLVMLAVVRTPSGSPAETLFEKTLSGAGARRLDFPACAGDVISVSALSVGGTVRLTLERRTFGVKMED